MDMIVFPYNDMFSYQIQKSKIKKCYFVKLNNERIKFTHFLYWKKDILEQAPLKYADYLNSNHQHQISIFLKSKIQDSLKLSFWERKLNPSQNDPTDWLNWYSGFSEKKLNKGDSLSLVEYHVSTVKNLPMFTDSFTICKSTIK
jgi:hypothetical protein